MEVSFVCVVCGTKFPRTVPDEETLEALLENPARLYEESCPVCEAAEYEYRYSVDAEEE